MSSGYLTLSEVYNLNSELSEGDYDQPCSKDEECKTGLKCRPSRYERESGRCLPDIEIEKRWGARRNPIDQICSVHRNGLRIMVPDQACGPKTQFNKSSKNGGTFKETTLCHRDCQLIHEQTTGRIFVGRIATDVRGVKKLIPCDPECAEQTPDWIEYEN